MPKKATKKVINENISVCTKCFNTLGVESRMKIYRFLRSKGENTVTAVVNVVGLTQPTVSYHLKEMRGTGLLKSRKSGKEVYYRVNPECEKYHEECVLHKVKFPAEG